MGLGRPLLLVFALALAGCARVVIPNTPEAQGCVRECMVILEYPHIRQKRPEIHPEARVMHIRPGHDAAHLFLYRIRGLR
jgi:hypothetical protein